MKYDVDVKAFIRVTVEAENEDKARRAADNFISCKSPDEQDLQDWNELHEDEKQDQIDSIGVWDIDGESEVELTR
jgi:hypothetical protein